jgi:acyl-CoA thioester hydrolase
MTGDLTPPFIVTYRGTVYPWQCDHMGHMNVMWYVGKFDEASWQLLAMIGLTPSRFQHDGAGMAAVEQRVEYKRELRAGDVVTIRSAVRTVDNKAITVVHELLNDDGGEVAARMTLVGVHIDALGRKARPLPADVRACALGMIEEGSASNRDPDVSRRGRSENEDWAETAEQPERRKASAPAAPPVERAQTAEVDFSRATTF